MQYRALTEITYPTNKAAIERIFVKGERVTREERDEKTVYAGDIVDDIPDGDIAWLLEQRCIEVVEVVEPTRPSRKTRVEELVNDEI